MTDTGTHPVGYEYQMDAGQGCVNPTCHTNNLGTSWTASGSVYTRRESAGEPVVGAHVFITDRNGTQVEMVTAMNGFFFTDQPLVPPLTTYVSGCPDQLQMVAPALVGNCNAGGCHVQNYKIYLSDTP